MESIVSGSPAGRHTPHRAATASTPEVDALDRRSIDLAEIGKLIVPRTLNLSNNLGPELHGATLGVLINQMPDPDGQ